MNKFLIALLAVLVVVGLGYVLWSASLPENGIPSPVVANPPEDEPGLPRLTTPRPGSLVTSPLEIRGEAPGGWFFEASFPVRLFDANGRQLGVVPAQAQGEWMTSSYVPFAARLDFATSTTATGLLVLEKDNPSGLPENSQRVEFPVLYVL